MDEFNSAFYYMYAIADQPIPNASLSFENAEGNKTGDGLV